MHSDTKSYSMSTYKHTKLFLKSKNAKKYSFKIFVRKLFLLKKNIHGEKRRKTVSILESTVNNFPLSKFMMSQIRHIVDCLLCVQEVVTHCI